jgi:hypothetical protein
MILRRTQVALSRVSTVSFVMLMQQLFVRLFLKFLKTNKLWKHMSLQFTLKLQKQPSECKNSPL